MEASRAARRGSRAMTSPVNWGLLGLVISRPSYGLELAHRYERTYGEVWPMSSDSHVYPVLDALEGRGLIETIPGVGAGRQPKPHYRATALGVRSYEDWLVQQVDAEARRQELWVRQLGVFANDPNVALAVLDRFEEAYLRRAGKIGGTDHDQAGTASALVDALVAERQRIAVGGTLSWLRSAREGFQGVLARRSV
jgi:DNA-binding PadR family transcriptional regulator